MSKKMKVLSTVLAIILIVQILPLSVLGVSDAVEPSGSNNVLSDFDTHIVSAGRAGTVTTDVFDRSLTIQRSDIGLPGNIMPVNIEFTYNEKPIDFEFEDGETARNLLRNPYGEK